MSNLIFVATTGPGLQALEYARASGHKTTLLYAPAYDFCLTPGQRAEARRLADRCIEVDDPHDIGALVGAMRAAGIYVEGVDAVLSTVHACALPAADLARRLGVKGTSPDAITAARDKGACRRILDDRAIPNLRFAVVAGVAEAVAAATSIGFPVVVKPPGGFGAVLTAVARSQDDIEEHFTQIAARSGSLQRGVAEELDGRFLVEEMAVGPLFSIVVLGDGGALTPLVIVRRKSGRDNPILDLGSTMPCGLGACDERLLGDYAVQVCEALGLDFGLFHVEAVLTEGGPRLIEVNPRMAGGAVPDLVRAATDRDLFATLVDLHTGAAGPAVPFPAERGASHSFITSADDRAVSAGLSPDWFEAIRPRLHSGWTDITPGTRLRGMGGELDVRGMVRVVAATPAAAEDLCERLLSEIGGLLGIRPTPVATFEARR
ncbi:ATP-grasp domain-containing protein [Actinomadura graeca]|uniref:ATP-grasp domain-containing protein n=1 Tax=Actinomadura graeca TaxID=2750812 RepID=A0ABX8QWF7_9ACTN|nr:ATP-grasp domain-containing protein [Actinomadura graeca]QXJ23105.1 ATP-grasp domain-containing protein [Actinomadura graeca]